MKTEQALMIALFLIVGATYAQQSEAPQPRHDRIRLSRGVGEGLLKHKVNPVYPVEARKNRIQGDVVLDVLINESGDVTRAKTISGDPALAEAALEAVKQWKYRPFLVDGKPIGVNTTVLIKFHL